MLHILIVGLVAGILARIISPGPNNPSGFILTVVLGIAGALLATFVGQMIGHYTLDEGAAKVRDSVIARVPLKRASTAEDVANLVCFLATSASSNMTGEVVRMDAGSHLIT